MLGIRLGVIDLDIKGFFDTIDHGLMLKAVDYFKPPAWVRLYIERWLKSPAQDREGRRTERNMGTPQGVVISPVLANIFLHFAFDQWMKRNHPLNPFERYADDADLERLSELYNAKLRGWFNYFGKFRPSEMYGIFCLFTRILVKWARCKFKGMKGSWREASAYISAKATESKHLFIHWEVGWSANGRA